jgi:two-component system CheB/CheR fusion protein
MFHYTLNSNGFLFLGTSETIGQYTDLFSPVDNKQRLFKRKQVILKAHEHTLMLMPVEYEEKNPSYTGQHKSLTNINQLAEKLILDEYSLPCVFLNEKYDIIYFSGNTSPFLSIPAGEPTTNILKMVRKEIHFSLSIALHKAEREGQTITSNELHIKHDGEILHFNIIARPVNEPDIKEKRFMIIFDIKSTS